MSPARRSPAETRAHPGGPGHLDRARAYLGPACFPADREELLEHGVRHHAPPGLLQLLVDLPEHRSWPDLTAVLREVGVIVTDREHR